MGLHNFHEAYFSNAYFMMHISINSSFDRKLSTCIHVVLNTDNIEDRYYRLWNMTPFHADVEFK